MCSLLVLYIKYTIADIEALVCIEMIWVYINHVDIKASSPKRFYQVFSHNPIVVATDNRDFQKRIPATISIDPEYYALGAQEAVWKGYILIMSYLVLRVNLMWTYTWQH